MSTTDTRAAFKAWHVEKFGWFDDSLWPKDDNRYLCELIDGRWVAWQAALEWQAEAAKATGTAGELPELPEPTASSPHGAHLYSLDKMLSYARAAIHKQWCAEVNCDAVREELAELKAARQPAPVALSDDQINDLWNALPGIEIHNKAYAQGMSTDYALRIAFAKAILAATNRSQP